MSSAFPEHEQPSARKDSVWARLFKKPSSLEETHLRPNQHDEESTLSQRRNLLARRPALGDRGMPTQVSQTDPVPPTLSQQQRPSHQATTEPVAICAMPPAPRLEPFIPNETSDLSIEALNQALAFLTHHGYLKTRDSRRIRYGFWIMPLCRDGEITLALLYRGEAIYLKTCGNSIKHWPSVGGTSFHWSSIRWPSCRLQCRMAHSLCRVQPPHGYRSYPASQIASHPDEWAIKDCMQAIYTAHNGNYESASAFIKRTFTRTSRVVDRDDEKGRTYPMQCRKDWVQKGRLVTTVRYRGAYLHMTPKGQTLPIRPGLFREMKTIREWETGSAESDPANAKSIDQAAQHPRSPRQSDSCSNTRLNKNEGHESVASGPDNRSSLADYPPFPLHSPQ